MAYQTIFNQGSVTVIVAATESIAVQAVNFTQVFQEVGFPQMPASQSLLGTILSGVTVFGPFTNATRVTIQAGANGAQFATGVSPQITDTGKWQLQTAPAVIADGGAMVATAANVLNGIVTATPTAARSIQMPTGASIDAAVTIAVGESFDFTLITLAAFVLTLTVNTGVTFTGAVTTAATAGAAASFRARKSAAATYDIIRLT